MPSWILILLILSGVVAATMVTWRAFREAKDGFEDDEGFHLKLLPDAKSTRTPRKQKPQDADTGCFAFARE